MVELSEATQDQMKAELRRREADKVRRRVTSWYEVTNGYGKYDSYGEAWDAGLEMLAAYASAPSTNVTFEIRHVHGLAPEVGE